ncbi:MAG: phosphoribosyltransferase family protein [Pyrinomonadaceae bacterium]
MWLTHKFDVLYDATLALVYPQACAVCGAAHVERRADAPACAPCWRATRIFTGAETCCWKCGALALAELPAEQRADVRCRRCDAEAFTAARAVGVYEGALRAAVLTLKRTPHVGAQLGHLLFIAQQRPPIAGATRIIPVPLHPERQRERGFNQAAVLAQAVARRTGLPLDERSLVRTTHTAQHRAGMDARARRETVATAFEVARPRLVAGETILLVDDVYTTGATVSACAHALTEAGATAVSVLTVARA